MHRLAHSFALMLLSLILVLGAGCAGTKSISHTPTASASPAPATPPGLLMFSSAGKRSFDQAGNATENYATTLYNLNPQTGAILWKTQAYTGQALQQPVVLGTRAIFAIGANLSNASSVRSGTVSIYAVDLATGAVSQLATLQQVYNYTGFRYDLQLARLNATTAVLRYVAVQNANSYTMTLLAFTSTPDTPVWQANLPDKAFLDIMSVVDGTVYAVVYESTTKSFSLIAVKGADGSILWNTPLTDMHAWGGNAFADGGMLFLTKTASSTPSGSSEWGIAAYSLKDGSLVWKQPLNGQGTAIYGAANGLVFYAHSSAQGNSLIAAHTSDGSQAWTAPLPGYASVDSDSAHLYMTFSGQGSQVTCIGGADGKTLWSHAWSSAAAHQTSISDLVVYQRVVYFGVTAYDTNLDPTLPSTVYALSATDGSTLWHQTLTGRLDYPAETNHL